MQQHVCPYTFVTNTVDVIWDKSGRNNPCFPAVDINKVQGMSTHVHCAYWRTSFSCCWMVLTAADGAPWLTAPHWHDHTSMAVSTAHWSSTLLIPEEWLCGLVHSIQQKTGLVHSRSECWMRLVPMALPSSTNASHPQTMLTKSLWFSSDSDGHSLMMPALMNSRSVNDSSQEQATSSIVVMKGLRHNQQCLHKAQINC